MTLLESVVLNRLYVPGSQSLVRNPWVAIPGSLYASDCCNIVAKPVSCFEPRTPKPDSLCEVRSACEVLTIRPRSRVLEVVCVM